MFANSGGNAPYFLGSLLPSGNYDFLLYVNMEADLLQVSDWEVVLPLPQRLNLVDKIFGLSWSLHTSKENLSFIYCRSLQNLQQYSSFEALPSFYQQFCFQEFCFQY